VVIRHCEELSPTKYYYIRNVVKQFPRNTYYENLQNNQEKENLQVLPLNRPNSRRYINPI